MVIVKFDPVFEKTVKKIKDASLKNKVKKQIINILKNPDIGKPMRFTRKGTREVYIPLFRLSYLYLKDKNVVLLLNLHHKDEQ